MNIMKTMAASGAFACVALTTSMATAATFDFGGAADAFKAATTFEGTWNQAVERDPSIAGTAGDVMITSITTTAIIGDERYRSHAFLDSDFSTAVDNNGVKIKDAGLGVCHSGFSRTHLNDIPDEIYDPYNGVSGCATGGGAYIVDKGDDNITVGESLTIHFSAFSELTKLIVHDGKHNQITADIAVRVKAGDGDYVDLSASNGVVDLSGLGTSNYYTFRTNKGRPQIYLTTMTVSEVPLPAGAVLLLSAVGGLALTRRRKAS